MPRRGRITARIYNLKGRLVRTLLAEERDAGRHEITWNGLDDTGAGTASGVYLLRLDACDRSALRKLTLLK